MPRSMLRYAPTGRPSDDISSGTRKTSAWPETGGHFFDRSATVFLRLPDPLGDLRPAPTLVQLLPQGVRIIPFTCRDDFEALARTTPFAAVHLDRIKQRHDLGALIPVGCSPETDASSGLTRSLHGCEQRAHPALLQNLQNLKEQTCYPGAWAISLVACFAMISNTLCQVIAQLYTLQNPSV